MVNILSLAPCGRGKNFLATKELRNSGEGLIVDKFSSLEVEKKLQTYPLLRGEVAVVRAERATNAGEVSTRREQYDNYPLTLALSRKAREILLFRNNFPFSTFNFQFFAGARGFTCPTRHTALDPTSINANKTDRFRIKFGITINRNNFPFSTFNFQFFAGARGITCPTRHAELVSASYQLVVIRPVGQILNNLKITDKCPYFLRFQNDTLNTSLNKPFNSTWRTNPC